MRVKKIMEKEFETVTPAISIEHAAQVMQNSEVGVLPVKSNGDLLGVVTDRDITIRAVADGRNPRETLVGDIMTRELICVNEDNTIQEAVKRMKIYNLRRLLVLNDTGQLVGLVTLVPW
jgi:CBS domain-containing protein